MIARVIIAKSVCWDLQLWCKYQKYRYNMYHRRSDSLAGSVEAFMSFFSLLPAQLPVAAIAYLFIGVSYTSAEAAIPSTLLFDSEHLAAVRAGKFSQDAEISRARNELRERADQALQHEPYSVTHQSELAASGDPHDYVSFATYWWPNPDTADGLPYARRDGHENKKLISQGDRELLEQMHTDVLHLALAGYLFDEPRYSGHAAKMLRVFFLDSETRMNPNLRHAQLIRGVCTGRPIGIIDTEVLVWTLEAVRILELSDSLAATDRTGIRQWFRDYLRWLRHDPFCKPEQRAKNNHGTFFDFQVVGFSLFVGDRATATQVLEAAKQERIALQIEPDGRQPLEAQRTKGLDYSCGNLHGLCALARLGEACDVDLWHYESPRGSSIVKAYDFLLPYVKADKLWPWQQIVPPNPRRWVEPIATPCYWLDQRFPGRNYLLPVTLSTQQGKQVNLACLVYSQKASGKK